MQVKNISGHDISFMFTSPKGTSEMPRFDTVNIVRGWTVEISEEIWKQIAAQTISVCDFIEETVDITEGNPTIKSFGGEKTVPKRVNRIWAGTSKQLNMIEHMVKTRQIELIEDEKELALPPRNVMEAFLKRYGEKITSNMTDDELAEKVRVIKAEIEALSNL